MIDPRAGKVAVVGLGKMGSAMAAQLKAGGCQIVGWARSEAARAQFAELGGDTVASLGDLGDVDLAITMVNDDKATRAVALEANGLVGVLKPGAIHVGMSTISTVLARELQEAQRKSGHEYLSAPVFGRPEAAQAAGLSIVCSGPRQVYDAAEPFLKVMGVSRWIGEQIDLANVVKLAGNQMILTAIELLAEVFALLRKAGVSEDDAHSLLVERLFPGPIFNGYSAKIRGRHWEPPGGDLFLARKDNGLCLAAGEELGVNLPLVRFIRDRLDQVIVAGEGAGDVSTLARYSAGEAGLDD